MPANSVMPPIELFTDTAGNPLDAGFIYIGEPGFDARSTPKAAFFDAALTIACPPAIRTSAGYPVRNGAAATIYVDGNHSMTVTDRNGVVVFSNLSRAFELGTPTTTLAQIVAPDGTLAQTGFGFASDTDTGLIRSANNQMQLVAGGTPVATIAAAGLTLTAALPVASGGTGATNLAGILTLLNTAIVTGNPFRWISPGAVGSRLMIALGTASTTGSGVTVTFPLAFSSAPFIQVTAIASGTPLFCTYQSPGSTSFVAQTWDAAGTQTAGSVSWLAIGAV